MIFEFYSKTQKHFSSLKTSNNKFCRKTKLIKQNYIIEKNSNQRNMIWLTLIQFLNKFNFFWHSASRDENFAPYFDNDLCSLPNRNSLTFSVQDVQLKMFLDSADYFFASCSVFSNTDTYCTAKK
jgi:hypothetical protein